MPAELVIAPEVEQDIVEACAWYSRNRAGLDKEFLNCLEACIETIRRGPERYALVYGNYRRALIRRFPYAVFYEYVGGVVTIYGVFHNAHDPEKWHQRLG